MKLNDILTIVVFSVAIGCTHSVTRETPITTSEAQAGSGPEGGSGTQTPLSASGSASAPDSAGAPLGDSSAPHDGNGAGAKRSRSPAKPAR